MNILDELEKEILSDPQELYFYEIEKKVNSIGKLLRQIRIDADVTQVHIAKTTGLSKQMVSKMESYNGNPTLSTLVKYCDCIGLDLVKLLERYYQETHS